MDDSRKDRQRAVEDRGETPASKRLGCKRNQQEKLRVSDVCDATKSSTARCRERSRRMRGVVNAPAAGGGGSGEGQCFKEEGIRWIQNH